MLAKQTVQQTAQLLEIWDAMTPIEMLKVRIILEEYTCHVLHFIYNPISSWNLIYRGSLEKPSNVIHRPLRANDVGEHRFPLRSSGG